MESLTTRLLNIMKTQQPVYFTQEEFAYILNFIRCGAKLELLEDLEHEEKSQLAEQVKSEFNELTKAEKYKEVYPFLEETRLF